jgi:Tfp pilus assembly protein PilV
MRKAIYGFTLLEMLVAIVLLVMIVLLVSGMLSSTTKITTVGSKRMDTDAQSRQLLDRMAIDFAQMVKRKDVSYFVKTQGQPQAGNDLIAFFSTVRGYYPTPSFQSPISLVSYRVNSNATSSSFNRLERMAKGLHWNGSFSGLTPIVFFSPTAPSPNPTTINFNWPAATNSSSSDSDYEIVGPQVFRFEYYYLLKPDPTGVPRPLSTGGLWPTTNNFTVGDVAAIIVAIAVFDPRSRVLLPTDPNPLNDPITKLAGRLPDASSGLTPGQLLSQWQTTLDGVTDMPRAAISAIRLYERYFYLSSPAP